MAIPAHEAADNKRRVSTPNEIPEPFVIIGMAHLVPSEMKLFCRPEVREVGQA